MPILEAQDVSKQYKMSRRITVNALSNVDLCIERGEFVAVMGPSGSGKSTLLHLLGGIDRPTSGQVVLDGQPLSLLGERQLTLLRRRQIGFIFQFFHLITTLSAEENILLPLLLDRTSTKQYKSRLDEILTLVGLEGRRRHRPDQLSGGEQQRVSIARALIINPRVILADEPTGNLDSALGLEILHLLQSLAANHRQTIVVATHDPRVADYAQRIVRLNDGKVCSDSPVNLAVGPGNAESPLPVDRAVLTSACP